MNILYLNRSMGIGGVEKCIVQLSELFNYNGKVVVASMGGELVRELEKSKTKHYNIIDTDSKNLVSILKNLITIYKIVKTENIDIIHSHHRMTTLLAKIVSKVTGTEVIHTEHSINKDKKILTKAILKSIKIIAVSKAVKLNLVKNYKISSSHIVVINNIIDTKKRGGEIDKRLLESKEQGHFIVGCISRLEKNKGLEVLLDAANLLGKYKERIKFFIIGDGSERKNLEEICLKKHLSDNVYFLGTKMNVIDHIDNFSLLVQPSLSEGLGLTAIEAISQGKPVIASDIPGLNEVIIDNYNGALFTAGNSEKLIEAIYNIYLDEHLREKMSKNALQHYNNNFDLKRCYISHKEIYQ